MTGRGPGEGGGGGGERRATGHCVRRRCLPVFGNGLWIQQRQTSPRSTSRHVRNSARTSPRRDHRLQLIRVEHPHRSGTPLSPFHHSSAYLSRHVVLQLHRVSVPRLCSGRIDAHRWSRRRSMQRAPRPPRRSTTPTSATFPSTDSLPPTTPTGTTTPKPLYLCSPFVEAALVKGNFKTIVMLPKYADVMEWVAVNSALLRCSSLVPGKLTRAMNVTSSLRLLHKPQSVLRCPRGVLHPAVMPSNGCRPEVRMHHPSRASAIIHHHSPSLNYTWINQDRKSVQLPAPTYVDYVMTWVQNLLDDDNVFPTKSGACLHPSDSL